MMWTIAGTIFLAIGIAGVILPMLPGTIFLFIASACFLRGSERLHGWLHQHPVYGRQLRILTGEEAMPVASKVFAISAMWIAVTLSVAMTTILPLQIVLVVLAVIGTFFITLRR
ncbi:MAG TPA: YbaN family protein [Thermoanaerobaculia bacterium]|nr:YbaN family protein [Thermoanaerobaculia bacterium]